MLFPTANIGDLSFRLLLIRPDFQPSQNRPWEVTHQIDTLIGEGRTTIEERRPLRSSMLLTQKCTLFLRGSEADDWRLGVASLGPLPVGIPLWIDALPPAQWANRIYDPQQIVGFDPDSGDFQIYAKGDLPGSPDWPLLAPLLLGRWKDRPEVQAFNRRLGLVEVELAEASPLSCRIGINSYGSSWSANPDWTSQPKDVSDYGLELIQLSKAREPALDRVNAQPRWSQEGGYTFMDRLEIRQALSWFVAKQGALHSWSPIPAQFFQGIDRPATPANYTGRFQSDTLQLTYLGSKIAQATIGFLQEVDGGRAQNQPGEVYLYRLKYDADPDNPELYTNWDDALSAGEGLFQPYQVIHQETNPSLKPQDAQAQIKIAFKDGSLLHDYQRARLYKTLWLTIWKCDPAAPADHGKSIFSGMVDDVLPEGNTLTVTASLFKRILGIQLPTEIWSSQCNTFLFSPECTKVETDLQSLGTIAAADISEDGMTVVVRGVSGFGGPDYADNWFAKGLFRTGSLRQYMTITIRSSVLSGDALELTLSRPAWADIVTDGQAVQLLPGCDRQGSTCDTKFGNHDNFRGMEFIPPFLAQVAPDSTPPKK